MSHKHTSTIDRVNSVNSANSCGIAVHTMVLILMIGMFTVVSLFLLYSWVKPSTIEANKISCELKRVAYCTDWDSNDYDTEPWDWEDRQPLNCQKFQINKPTSGDCEIF